MKTASGKAWIEDGTAITVGPELTVAPGDYVQVAGEVAVARLTKAQGLKIRQLIKSLDSYGK